MIDSFLSLEECEEEREKESEKDSGVLGRESIRIYVSAEAVVSP